MGRLQDKVAIVTGGSGGIGKATARRFLEEGAKVTVVDLSRESLEQTAAELAGLGDLLTVEADVTQEDQTKNYVDKTVEAFGTVDVLFNNAGIESKIQPLVEVTVEDFERVQSVNVTGVFLGLKHVLPILTAKRSGSVINMSSNGGLDGTLYLGPYITSKHAVSGMTKTAALEVAAYDVRVNSVHPCPVNTRMMREIESGFSPDNAAAAEKDFASRIPLGRYAEPDDVANVVVFLASDESTFLTGAQYRVDGGMGATP
ncbi:SDR family oxidoreductase [Nocardioides rotundus]|uniref:SDR family NAD(P)-dependent oxidoreductase n=1 Tax=Nocardioides rotundus TaxID=1774216 RepID=UPI001CBEF347|nr:SDR family oxidoreductase [Nocardioides rotundus]UAL29940.1 SDR family oxidoreductase [Nocardioides rotundus]